MLKLQYTVVYNPNKVNLSALKDYPPNRARLLFNARTPQKSSVLTLQERPRRPPTRTPIPGSHPQPPAQRLRPRTGRRGHRRRNHGPKSNPNLAAQHHTPPPQQSGGKTPEQKILYKYFSIYITS